MFITSRDSVCSNCGKKLSRHARVTLVGEKNVLCISCAGLGHLVYLPSGDAALTRRAAKSSRLTAVVLKKVRNRSRYERSGILVEKAALRQARQACLADADVRARRRARDARRRAQLERDYLESFAARVRQLFPGCPPGRETLIAEHACQKYSRRVGRSAMGKKLTKEAVLLAVKAHIRHVETGYDKLLAQGVDRNDARQEAKSEIQELLECWRSTSISGGS